MATTITAVEMYLADGFVEQCSLRFPNEKASVTLFLTAYPDGLGFAVNWFCGALFLIDLSSSERQPMVIEGRRMLFVFSWVCAYLLTMSAIAAYTKKKKKSLLSHPWNDLCRTENGVPRLGYDDSTLRGVRGRNSVF